MAKFKCKICGHIHEGDNAPEVCPVCKAPSTEFEMIEGGKPSKKGMDTNGNTYTVIYSTILVMAVAAILAFAASALKSKQDKNVKEETISKILTAAGLYEDGCDAITVYNENLSEAVLVNAEGQQVGSLAAGEVITTAGLKAQNDNMKAGASLELPIYKFNAGSRTISVVPCYGAGLWGPIWGYLAFGEDMNTIEGAVFDHKGETPGLGAKIADEPWFRAQFAGKTIFEGNTLCSVNIVKGGAKEGDEHAVDAISGATITSQSLDVTIKNWLTAYEAYFKSAASQNSSFTLVEE